MAYRSLLVHLDTDDRCDARVRAAARLALEHDAHLMGVAIGTAESTSTPVRTFRQCMHDCGVSAFDVRVDEGDPLEALVRHASHCDLAVLGASNPGGGVVPDLAPRFFLRAGRPALIIPDHGELEVLDTHVLVAWNGTREANRAIADALPWLQRARQVGVLCLDKADEALFSRLELNDLRDWLKRHGVTAQVTQQPAQWSVAEALLTWVRNVGCDLLVMGGYGHARASEAVFGGVTRSVLSAVSVPLLVSH